MKISALSRLFTAIAAIAVIGAASSCSNDKTASTPDAVSGHAVTYRVVTDNGANAETAVEGVKCRLGRLGISDPKVTFDKNAGNTISVDIPDNVNAAVVDSVLTNREAVAIYNTLNVTEMQRYGITPGDYAEKVAIATALNDAEKKAIVDRLVAAGVGSDIKLVWSAPKKVYVGEFADTGTIGYELYALRAAEVFRPTLINTFVKKIDGWKRLLLVFDAPDAREFVKFTESKVGRQLAVVVNDEVLSAPYIKSPVVEGRIDISGDYTDEQLRRMCAELFPLGPGLRLARK